MKKKKTYVGKGLKWFVDFLPDEIFNSMSDEEKKNYREYRRYQKEMGQGLENIKKLQKQIETIQRNIKGGGEVDGWESKMKMYYDRINHIDKNFKLNCSIERRDRSSITKKIKEGSLIKSKSDFTLKNTYGKKEIGSVIKLYGRVENSVHRHQIYLGDERNIRLVLSTLYNEDWSNEPYEFLKDELRSLVSQYSRYHIFHNKWEGFKSETHNLQSIIEWCSRIGEERYKWGGTR